MGVTEVGGGGPCVRRGEQKKKKKEEGDGKFWNILSCKLIGWFTGPIYRAINESDWWMSFASFFFFVPFLTKRRENFLPFSKLTLFDSFSYHLFLGGDGFPAIEQLTWIPQ